MEAAAEAEAGLPDSSWRANAKEATLTHKKHVPLRSCSSCRSKLPKRELIRIVVGSVGEVATDPTGKEPGRGVYFCYEPACWTKGLTKDRLCRSFRRDVVLLDRKGLLTQLHTLAAGKVGEEI